MESPASSASSATSSSVPPASTSFSRLAISRHSVRDFRTDPVPPEVIEEILEDARQAPSWSNTRPFMVALATGEQADRLREAYVEEFDATLPVQHKERGAMARLALTGVGELRAQGFGRFVVGHPLLERDWFRLATLRAQNFIAGAARTDAQEKQS